MFWLFVSATIFGGAFLVPMLFGGLASNVGDGLGGDFGDADLDLGSGLDVDVDMDLEVEANLGTEVGAVDAASLDIGGNDIGDALGSIFASLLSFRTIVFFNAFFGTSGLVFGALGYSPTITLLTAIVVGAIASLINSTLFGLIRNSQPNSQISDRTLEGRRAKVVLPMTPTKRGRIRIDLNGQPQYMVASPIDDRSGQQFDVGASVVVVEIENGTALVASLAELDSGEEY